MNKDDATSCGGSIFFEKNNVILILKQIQTFWLRMQNWYLKRKGFNKQRQQTWFMVFPLLFRVLGWRELESIGSDVL